PLLIRKGCNHSLEVAQFQSLSLGWAHRERHFFYVNRIPASRRTSDGIDILVVHHREEPGSQIGASRIEMTFFERAQNRVLHEIVGAVGIAHQSAGVASQSGNLSLDELTNVGHEKGASVARQSFTKAID